MVSVLWAENTNFHCTTDLQFLVQIKLLMLNEPEFCMLGQIQTSQTGGYPYIECDQKKIAKGCYFKQS